MERAVPALFDQFAGQQAADQAGGSDKQDFIGHSDRLRSVAINKPS